MPTASLLAERLILIIRERACPTLYTSGWLTFQKYYPARGRPRSGYPLQDPGNQAKIQA